MAVIPAVFNLSAFPAKRRWGRGRTGAARRGGGAGVRAQPGEPAARAARINICFAGLGPGGRPAPEGGRGAAASLPSSGSRGGRLSAPPQELLARAFPSEALAAAGLPSPTAPASGSFSVDAESWGGSRRRPAGRCSGTSRRLEDVRSRRGRGPGAGPGRERGACRAGAGAAAGSSARSLVPRASLFSPSAPREWRWDKETEV
ncbi:uncharacterized protein WM277_021790 [Molossus nigricans]